MPNYECHKHNLHYSGEHHLEKALCDSSVRSLKEFLNRDGKSVKNAYIMPHCAN